MADKTIGELTLDAAPAPGDWIETEKAAGAVSRRVALSSLIGGTITGGGSINTGGFALTVPATGTASLLGVVQSYSALKTFSAGISFGQDTLDNYDIDTWVPVIADAPTAGNTGTLSANFARYARVGKQVTVWASCTIGSVTGMTGANTMHLRGLPFPSLNFTNFRAYATPRLVNTTFTGIPLVFLPENISYLRFIEQPSAGVGAFLTVSDFPVGSEIYLTLTYLIT